MFRSPCPLPALILWCRALRHGLDVGLSPVRVFRQQAKSGPAVFRPVADRMAGRLEAGESLSDALKPEAWRFPLLFVELVAVGEQAGRLPVIFQELEQHYEALLDARRKFLSALVYPAMMYVGAVLILTVLILVLGSMQGLSGKPIDPLGLGLSGSAGAVLFLAYAVGFTVFVVGGVLIVVQNPNAKAAAEAFALKIPGLAPVVRAFALQRFSMAAHMMIEAGLRADRVLKSSLRATANKAYQAEGERAAKLARKGKEIVETLGKLGPHLFPDAFLQAVAIGEESGRLAEVLLKEAEIYREESIRGLKLLARIVSGLVYAVIAILVIVCIFRVINATYLGQINEGLDIANDPDKWLRGGK